MNEISTPIFYSVQHLHTFQFLIIIIQVRMIVIETSNVFRVFVLNHTGAKKLESE